MAENWDYLRLLSDFVKKQMVILGPSIALAKARKIGTLSVADDGQVTTITGDPQASLEMLLNEYMNLSGKVAQNVLHSLLEKYPSIRK